MYHFWKNFSEKRESQLIGERGCKWHNHSFISEEIWMCIDVWFHVVMLSANANTDVSLLIPCADLKCFI